MSGSLQEVQLLLLGVPVSANALEATGSVMEGVRHQAQLDVVVPAKLTLKEHPGVRVGRALFGRRLRFRFHTHLATSLSVRRGHPDPRRICAESSAPRLWPAQRPRLLKESRM